MNREKKIRIAIDGPSGAGKSTIAKLVAEKLQIDYIDTGAMYRAIGYEILRQGVSLEEEEALKQLLEETDVDFSKGDILLNGVRINEQIRTPEISAMASKSSSLAPVREKLVAIQKEMGQRKSVVMDGRDIGTNVLPDAEYKFYMTASSQERAHRRWKELTEKGEDLTVEQVELDLVERDKNDSTRKLNPLRRADDAIELDTTGKSIEQVVQEVLEVMTWQS